jgi:hypothetical protein
MSLLSGNISGAIKNALRRRCVAIARLAEALRNLPRRERAEQELGNLAATVDSGSSAADDTTAAGALRGGQHAFFD